MIFSLRFCTVSLELLRIARGGLVLITRRASSDGEKREKGSAQATGEAFFFFFFGEWPARVLRCVSFRDRRPPRQRREMEIWRDPRALAHTREILKVGSPLSLSLSRRCVRDAAVSLPGAATRCLWRPRTTARNAWRRSASNHCIWIENSAV